MTDQSHWRGIVARLGAGPRLGRASDEDFADLGLVPRDDADTFEAAWKRCDFSPTLLWLAGQVAQTEVDNLAIVKAACACATLAAPCGPAGDPRFVIPIYLVLGKLVLRVGTTSRDTRLVTAIKQVAEWAAERQWRGSVLPGDRDGESRERRAIDKVGRKAVERARFVLDVFQTAVWEDPETAGYRDPPDMPLGAVWDELVGHVEPYTGKPLTAAHATAKAHAAAVAAVRAATESVGGAVFAADCIRRWGKRGFVFADFADPIPRSAMRAAEWTARAVAYTTWSEGGNGDDAFGETRRRCANLVREHVPHPTLDSLAAAVARREARLQSVREQTQGAANKRGGVLRGWWRRLRADRRPSASLP